jgi:hypothetical protein
MNCDYPDNSTKVRTEYPPRYKYATLLVHKPAGSVDNTDLAVNDSGL